MSATHRQNGIEPGGHAVALPLPEALRTAYALLARAEASPDQRSIVAYGLEALGRAMRLASGPDRDLGTAPELGRSTRRTRPPEAAAALGGTSTCERAAVQDVKGTDRIPDNDTAPVEMMADVLPRSTDPVCEVAVAHHRAEEALQLVDDVSAGLASPLPLAESLFRLATLSVPRMGDLCIVDQLDDDGWLRLAAWAHADPRKVEGLAHAPADVTHARLRPSLRALLDGGHAARLVGHEIARAGEWFGAARLAWLDGLAPRAVLVVPLVSQGRSVGVMTLATERAPGRPEVLLAEVVARRAAQAIDNARLHDEAQRAIRMRDEFLGVASHELRTPLTLLQLEVQGLLRTARKGQLGNLTEEQLVTRLSRAEGGVKRLGRMVGDLLDVSRLASGPLSLDLEHVDLARVVEDVVAHIPSRPRQSDVIVNAAPGALGLWDRRRVEQLVSNLVSNGIKFGDGHPVEVKVEFDDRNARLSVRDHGVGIAPQHLRRIFGRFERAASERNYGGLGLGLYMVQQIVDALGGRVAVESRPGEGSRFIVQLPRSGPPAQL